MTKSITLLSVIEDYAKATANKNWQEDQGSGQDLAKAKAEYNIAAHNLHKFLRRRPKVVAFAIGDRVKFKPGCKAATRFTGAFNALVITDSSVTESGEVTYSINGAPSYPHSHLLLVSSATKASLLKARALVLSYLEEV